MPSSHGIPQQQLDEAKKTNQKLDTIIGIMNSHPPCDCAQIISLLEQLVAFQTEAPANEAGGAATSIPKGSGFPDA